MFERFTDQARRAIVLAQEEARGLDHNYIGTEHMLLGLLHDGEDMAAARLLTSAGITLEAARAELIEITPRGDQAPAGHIPFTPRAKKVLELAFRESNRLEDYHIGTGHLLLALIGESDGLAAQILNRLGANLDDLRERAAAEPSDDPEARRGRSERPVPDPGHETPWPMPRPGRDVGTVLRRVEARLTATEARLAATEARLTATEARLTAIERRLGIDPGEAGTPPAAG